MARIAWVLAPDIPYHIAQGGTGGMAGEMRMVPPEFQALCGRNKSKTRL